MKVFEWDDLRIFLAIKRGRSVRAASKLLKVSHSTVSRRLQAMEEQLGIKLFTRQVDGFVLTETGEAMVERAERVESEILSLEREVFGRDALLSGPVRISVPPVIAQRLLIGHLAEFTRMYPEIEIEVDATFDVADLRRRNADIAIRFQSEAEASLISHPLPDLCSAIYATPSYLSENTFSGPNPTGRWVVLGGREVLAHWRHSGPYSQLAVQHVVSDMYTHVEAVKANMGIGYLLCFLGDAESELVRVPVANTLQTIKTWIVTHPDMMTTERVRVLSRFLQEALWQRADELGGMTA